MSVLVLDSGAVTALARRNPKSTADTHLVRTFDVLLAVVPAVVLVECLSGRPHTDTTVNRFLKRCQIVDGPQEKLARRAGSLRAQAGRGSAVDAVVVAMAEPGGSVLTSDTKDLCALASRAQDVKIVAV